MKKPELASTIERPSRRATTSAPRPGRRARGGRAALDLLDPGAARVAEKATALAGQPVAEEGRAAVLSAQRHERDPGRPRAAAWWDKVPSKFEGWGDNRFRAAGFRAVPGCIVRRSAYHRAGRGADAVLRQSRRLCRRGHDGRHLGDRRLLRADRQELPYFRRRRDRRRARAAAGRPGHHRGQLLHRRAGRGGRRRHRPRGSVLSMGVYLGASTRSSTAPPARSFRRGAALFGRGVRHAARRRARGAPGPGSIAP